MTSEHRENPYNECILMNAVDGAAAEAVASGGGPVDAIYRALQRMLQARYPSIKEVRLENYKVRIALDKGPESTVRVYIEFANGGSTWGTAGISPNILEASMEAIQKGFTYYILKCREGSPSNIQR